MLLSIVLGSPTVSPVPIRPGNVESPFSGSMAGRQAQHRQVLAEAHATSFGCFVVTDSQFGNPIMPVLPRVEEKKSPS